MQIQPYILGSGNSGKAMANSLAILKQLDPELRIKPAVNLKRNPDFRQLPDSGEALPLLFIANPHGLHAQTLIQADQAGIRAIVCDKPVCVRPEEIALLKELQARVWVCHGYRESWGIQTLRQLVSGGELGEIFSIEGKYWQCSSAQRALLPPGDRAANWKNDPALNGPYDTLVDLGTHWIDLMFFLLQERSRKGRAWLSHVNSESAHRDSHVHLDLEFPRGTRARASISKNVHGATNELELSVLGNLKSATWRFQNPDELQLGTGNQVSYLRRGEKNPSTQSSPFHGMGWIEGYVRVIHQALLALSNRPHEATADLKSSIEVMETIHSLEIEKR